MYRMIYTCKDAGYRVEINASTDRKNLYGSCADYDWFLERPGDRIELLDPEGNVIDFVEF